MVEIRENNNDYNKLLRVAGIVRDSVADGVGLRFVVFCQGCLRNCPGCQNPGAKDPRGGVVMTVGEIIRDYLASGNYKGVTISGGEPFNQAGSASALARAIKEIGGDVVVYTGGIYESVVAAGDADALELIAAADYIVDGDFRAEERVLFKPFRGSDNQRYIDVKKTRELGRVVEVEF